MNRENMAKHMQKMAEIELGLREAGQKEYAHDEDNAFRNFESTADELGISREKVLWIFVRKHFDGIKAHINGHTSQRESIHGRIHDARVYLALLDGMIIENEKNDQLLGPSTDL